MFCSAVLQLQLIMYSVTAITIENAVSVNKWWYQCILSSSESDIITSLQVRSYGTNTSYITCIQEQWPPFPWTCHNDRNPFIVPLTLKITNTFDQQLIMSNVILSLTPSAQYTTDTEYTNHSTITTSVALPTTSTATNNAVPPFISSTLTTPYAVGYITTVLCDIARDFSCLASIGLPGYSLSLPHPYNVLVFGSYIISNKTAINALQFWFNPTQYLTSYTITQLTGSERASNDKIRMILHNIYAKHNITILLSTFGAEDDDKLKDNWIERGMSPYSVANDLSIFVRDYWFDGININSDTQTIYFNQEYQAEIDLIILTSSLNAALNRNAMPSQKYFIITHSADSILFQNGGYLMVHSFCGHLIDWYNIKYYISDNTTINDTFHQIFTSTETSVFKLSLASSQIVVTQQNHNGFLLSKIFAGAIKLAVSSSQCIAGVMVYDFYSDLERQFEYSYTVIWSLYPTSTTTTASGLTSVPIKKGVKGEVAKKTNVVGIMLYIVLAVFIVIVMSYVSWKLYRKFILKRKEKNESIVSQFQSGDIADPSCMTEEQATRVFGKSILIVNVEDKADDVELAKPKSKESLSYHKTEKIIGKSISIAPDTVPATVAERMILNIFQEEHDEESVDTEQGSLDAAEIVFDSTL